MNNRYNGDTYDALQRQGDKYRSWAFFLSGLGGSAIYLGFSADFRPMTASGLFLLVGGAVNAIAALDASSNQEYLIQQAVDFMAEYEESER